MKHDYIFEFARIVLKPLDHEDIQNLRVLRNKERQFFSSQFMISEEKQEEWYKNYLSKSDDIMFKVVKKEALEDFVGAIAVYDIDYKQSIAEVGRTLIDKERCMAKGIGLDATRAVCKFAFDVLNIKKILGIALKTNERILKVDQRAGFVISGDYDANTYALEMTVDTIRLE